MRRWLLKSFAMMLMCAASAAGQPPGADDKAERLRSRWSAILSQVAADHELTVSPQRQLITRDGQAATDEQKTAVYRAVIEALVADPILRDFFEPDPSLVGQTTPPDEAEWVQRLAQSGAGEKGAKSVNAAATNPAAPKAAERSGFTDLVALALDARNIVAADKSAVSINLNALALFGLNSKTLSAPAAYRRYDALRRVGGTFTFGAKVPEGEITGLTGLPSADTLFDVFSWDAKVRVVGDRDPRAQRWYDVMLGTLGGLVEMEAALGAFVPPGDLGILRQVATDRLGAAVQAVRTRLSKSLQVSVKAAGQHLTTAKGKNKYTFGVLGDQGFGDTDVTFNVLYSTVDDVTISPASALYTVKTWFAAVGVNTLVARDVLVQGRAMELSLNLNGELAVDKSSLPIERKNLWRVVGAVTLPWGDAAKIPVSLTFTNDPNNLKKEKYVSGYVGVSYDFSALKSLFKPQVQ